MDTRKVYFKRRVPKTIKGANLMKKETIERKIKSGNWQVRTSTITNNNNINENQNGNLKSTSDFDNINENQNENLKSTSDFDDLQKLRTDLTHIFESNDKEKQQESILQIDEMEVSSSDSESSLPPIEVEFVRPIGHTDPKTKNIHGRRIVNIAHVFTEARKLENHECKARKKGYFSFESEFITGFQSKFVFKCTTCGEKRIIESNPGSEDKKKNINFEIVWGTVTAGKGYSGLEDIASTLDIPIMSDRTYKKYEDQIGIYWMKELITTMENAAREELEYAKELGKMYDDIGLCTVVVDGGWSHRSYKHSYTAKSGVAVIIGFHTKKLLFVGVRNKYCSICAIAESRNNIAPNHICYRNWHGSSPAMEADIIVEGFLASEKQYNLRYVEFIGDGDSSVHKRIMESVPFTVKKIECTNHLVKRVKQQLYKYAAKGKSSGKYLTNKKITFICKYTNKIISINSKEDTPSEDLLLHDLEQVIPHCFDNHENCRSEVCTDAGMIMDNNTYGELSSEMKINLHSAIGLLILNSRSVIRNMTSNSAEQYMHMVSKFTGGKQVFYGRRNSFQTRTSGAALSYQYGPDWIYKSLRRNNNGTITGKYLKKITDRRVAKLKRLQQCKRKSNTKESVGDKTAGKVDYGSNCEKPDMDDQLIKERTYSLINKLCVTKEDGDKIEIETRGQSENSRWSEERLYRLTASNFGEVCKRRAPGGPLVKKILYTKDLRTPAIEWGRIKESIAIEAYKNKTGNQVIRCGLFICTSPYLGYLGASPDGLVGTDKVIEIKCPYSARHLSPKEAAVKIKTFCSTLINNKLTLKRNHNYYYQVQGQMHITGRQKCDFVIWTPKGIEIETIEIDPEFICKMLPKLEQFYKNDLAIEIVDSRRDRSMLIRHQP